MFIDLTSEQSRAAQQIRAYFRDIVTPEYEAEIAVTEGGGPEYMKALKQMGADGWLGVGWPKEYGGQGRTPIEQFIFFDEAWRAGVLLPTLTIMSVSPMIMQHGTEEQKQFFLPKALHGEVHFAIGYTEPGAGTDLASLRTRAVRDGDHWVINGSKLFTSQAQYADYIWLAARTDPDAKKHDGISIFMVPDVVARLQDHAAAHDGRRHHQRDLLRGCAGAGERDGRAGERRLVAHRRPAEPRARGADSRRTHRALLRGDPRLGTRDAPAGWSVA